MTQCYIAFVAFAAQYFEGFLLQFQSEQPMIHLLYQGMCKLYNSILMKFVNEKSLYDSLGNMKNQTQILAIDLTNKENFKKTSLL